MAKNNINCEKLTTLNKSLRPTEHAKENAHCLRKLPVTKVDIPSIEVSQRVLGVQRNCCLVVCHRVLLLTHKLVNHTTICQEFCCSIDLQHNRRRIWHLGIAFISNSCLWNGGDEIHLWEQGLLQCGYNPIRADIVRKDLEEIGSMSMFYEWLP